MKIILPAVAGLDYRTFGVGYPTAADQTRTVGGGFTTINRAFYCLNALTGTPSFSADALDWLTQVPVPGVSLPWALPFAVTFFSVIQRINENRSCICPAMIGGVSNPNTLLDFDQWRLDISRKRCGLLIERDAAGVITWQLSWSNGVTQNSKAIAAIADGVWISLMYDPATTTLRLYVNGALWNSATDPVNMPTGQHTDSILYSNAVLKVLATAPEVSLRLYGPQFLAARTLPT